MSWVNRNEEYIEEAKQNKYNLEMDQVMAMYKKMFYMLDDIFRSMKTWGVTFSMDHERFMTKAYFPISQYNLKKEVKK